MEEAEGEKGGRGWMESMFAVENFSQIKKKGGWVGGGGRVEIISVVEEECDVLLKNRGPLCHVLFQLFWSNSTVHFLSTC